MPESSVISKFSVFSFQCSEVDRACTDTASLIDVRSLAHWAMVRDNLTEN